MTVGEYEDGRPGEVFMKVSKQGSTLSGVMDAFSIAVSLGLQHGVPMSTFVRKYTNLRFEPAGITDDPELRLASSLVDYIFRRLALDYLSFDERLELGVLSTGERTQPTLPGLEDMDSGDAERTDRERFGAGGDTAAGRRPTGTEQLRQAGQIENRDAPSLLRLRQRHAARRLALRVPELRFDERLLVARARSPRAWPRAAGCDRYVTVTVHRGRSRCSQCCRQCRQH